MSNGILEIFCIKRSKEANGLTVITKTMISNNNYQYQFL